MKTYLSIFAAIFCIQLWAQGPNHDQKDMKHADRIKSMKIAFITEQVDLSSEEAQVFWPVYNKFDKTFNELHQKQSLKGHHQRHNQNEDLSTQNLSETDALKELNKQLELEKSKVATLASYQKELLEVLPASKVLKVLKSEHQFRRKLLRRLGKRKDRRQDRR